MDYHCIKSCVPRNESIQCHFLTGKSLFLRRNFFWSVIAFSKRKAFLERIIEMEALIMRLIEFTWTQARHRPNATNLSLRFRSNEGRRSKFHRLLYLSFSLFSSPSLLLCLSVSKKAKEADKRSRPDTISPRIGRRW